MTHGFGFLLISSSLVLDATSLQLQKWTGNNKPRLTQTRFHTLTQVHKHISPRFPPTHKTHSPALAYKTTNLKLCYVPNASAPPLYLNALFLCSEMAEAPATGLEQIGTGAV